MAIISVQGALLCERIRTPEDVGDELRELLGPLAQEVLIAIALDARSRVLGLDVVALGSSWRACTEPLEVFVGTLRRNGSGMLVANNYPSGLTSPGPEEVTFTECLLEAGELLGIEVIDHIIVSPASWRSLRESIGL